MALECRHRENNLADQGIALAVGLGRGHLLSPGRQRLGSAGRVGTSRTTRRCFQAERGIGSRWLLTAAVLASPARHAISWRVTLPHCAITSSGARRGRSPGVDTAHAPDAKHGSENQVLTYVDRKLQHR